MLVSTKQGETSISVMRAPKVGQLVACEQLSVANFGLDGGAEGARAWLSHPPALSEMLLVEWHELRDRLGDGLGLIVEIIMGRALDDEQVLLALHAGMEFLPVLE